MTTTDQPRHLSTAPVHPPASQPGSLCRLGYGSAHARQTAVVWPLVIVGLDALAPSVEAEESWWLMELPGSGGGEVGCQIELPGADAITVGAPAVCAPPGPILFLPALTDAARAVPAAIAKAPDIGCSAIVVNQIASDNALRQHLAEAGFKRHRDYYTGTI